MDDSGQRNATVREAGKQRTYDALRILAAAFKGCLVGVITGPNNVCGRLGPALFELLDWECGEGAIAGGFVLDSPPLGEVPGVCNLLESEGPNPRGVTDTADPASPIALHGEDGFRAELDFVGVEGWMGGKVGGDGFSGICKPWPDIDRLG